MKQTQGKHRLHHWWKRLQLKDQFLLIFMLLLLLQSALNLFTKNLAIAETSPLDIVIRTTSATIFGYFIGIGFLRETALHHTKKENKVAETTRLEQRLVSPSAKDSASIPEGDVEHVLLEHEKRFRQQITIVASIGILSLVMLLLASNIGGQQTMEATATLSQLRDFVSGSVGFLVGHSTKH